MIFIMSFCSSFFPKSLWGLGQRPKVYAYSHNLFQRVIKSWGVFSKPRAAMAASLASP